MIFSFDKPLTFDIFDGKTLKDLDPFNITSDFGGDIPLDANFAWLLFLLLMSLVWVTYCVYYNSRVVAYIVTLVMNGLIIPRYFDGGQKSKGKKCEPIYVRFGSLSISFISGKMMFRDVVLATSDYSLRVQDGLLIFRWWLPYAPKDVRRTDLSHSDSRLGIVLNGFELHIYNRSQLYSRLEKVFNLPPRMFASADQTDDESNCETEHILKESTRLDLTNDDLIKAYLWRDLIPLTKVEVSTGRFVFGNHLTPSTLTVTFEEANMTYTSRPALSPHDLFTHIAKFKVESFKVILVPSPKFLGLMDEPPRYVQMFKLEMYKLVMFELYLCQIHGRRLRGVSIERGGLLLLPGRAGAGLSGGGEDAAADGRHGGTVHVARLGSGREVRQGQ